MTWSEISFSLRNLLVRAFDSRAQGFSPPLARQRSSCPPPSPNLVRTHLIENHQALRDSAPCLSRAATLPKATKLELGRGAHLKTPSSANHTAAASQPTGRIAKAASWLHLSRVSPALLPPERPSCCRGIIGLVIGDVCTDKRHTRIRKVTMLITSKSSDRWDVSSNPANWDFSSQKNKK